jgi:hypothetical protein
MSLVHRGPTTKSDGQPVQLTIELYYVLPMFHKLCTTFGIRNSNMAFYE